MKMLLALVAVFGVAMPMMAQELEFPKPGPEHDILKKMEGHWDCTIKGPADSKGKMTYKMDLGGLWLVGTFEAEMFGGKFSGRGLDTYDQMKKKYTSVWVDSMSTTPLVFEGTYDKEKKALTQTADGPGPDGKLAKYKSVTTYKSDDEFTFVLNMVVDSKDMPMITIEYKRKK